MERVGKVVGNGQGPYNIDIDGAQFGGIELHVWAASHYNHDRILLQLTPDQADELAASLVRHALADRNSDQSQRRAKMVEDQMEQFRGEEL
jgi:hypothetical protein